MSIEAINHIMKTAIADGIAKLVAICLADYAKPDTAEAWPKISTLARLCSQSERTVQRKLRLLEELGIIAVIPQLERGRQKENRYVIRLPGSAHPPRGCRGDRIDAAGDASCRGDTQSPRGESGREGCQPVTGTGDTADTPPVTLLSPLENPPLESTTGKDSPQPPDAGGRGRPRVFRGNGISEPVRPVARRRDVQPALDPADAERFERLWSTFPEGGIAYADRLAAERIFAELTPEDQALAVAAVRGYRAQIERDGSKAKALHRWLKNRRFANIRPAPGAAAAPPAARSRVFVREGTPAWDAWADHLWTRDGKSTPRTWSDSHRAEGWWFPSELPPADSRAA